MRCRIGTHGSLLLAAQCVAFWPVWPWYLRRLADPSGDRWGIAALVAASVLVLASPSESEGKCAMRLSASPVDDEILRKRGQTRLTAFCGSLASVPVFRKISEQAKRISIPIFCFLPALYCAAYLWAPMMAAAAVAVFSLALVVRLERPFPVAVWGLLVLSLPLIPALEFYGGYPMRLVTGSFAAWILNALGYTVSLEGVVLRWNDKLVMIDAPCSGLRMFWGASFLMFTFAGVFNHDMRRIVGMACLACVLVIMANAARAVVLFFSETEIITLPSWGHEAVGAVLFLQMAIMLFWLAAAGKRKEKPCAV